MSSKLIYIVPRPRFGGHLGFLTRSVVDNHFELDIKRGKPRMLVKMCNIE